jgi:hypothetical protein
LISDSILAEWQRHRSRFANRWLNQMFGRRKVDRVGECNHPALEQAIEELASPHRERALKDLHLISAALVGDRVVLSCDDLAKGAFSILTAHPALRDLLWANPETDIDAVLNWLGRGAPNELRFHLSDV